MMETNQNGAQGGAIVAVSDARNALPAPNLAGVSQVDTHTHKLGLIQPPPDIRAIVAKTAQFVAKNGREFERRILQNEAGNAKFSFLQPQDPYHKYYEHLIEEALAADKGEDKAAGTAAAAPAAPAVPVVVPTAAALGAAPAKPVVPPTKPLEPPEEEQYTVHIPEGLAAIDLDLIKLTAQFVARNGKSFLTGLASREHANPQFNFLKPTHSLFGFFTALCDAYSRVLMPPKGLTDRLEKDAADRSVVLERCLKRLEWDRVKDKEAKDLADAAEAERMAMQTIDWHDFVVVETIEFYDDEDDELPPPMTLKEVIQMNKGAAYVEEEEAAAAAAGKGAAGAPTPESRMEMDEEEREMVAQAVAAGRAGAPAAAPPPALAPAPAAAAADEDMDMDMEQSDEEAEVRVVRNYKRQDPRQKAAEATKFMVSPITGELVPIDQMAEHMRISLIDPKWREQRETMLAKIKESTKASDEEINRNLSKLARTRPDIFGTTQDEMSALVGQQIQQDREEAAKKAAAAGPAGAPPAHVPTSAPAVLPPPPLEPPKPLPPPPAPPGGVVRPLQLPPPTMPPPVAGGPPLPPPPVIRPPPVPLPPPVVPPRPLMPPPAMAMPPPPMPLPPMPLPPMAPPRPPIPGAMPPLPGHPAPPLEHPDAKRQRMDGAGGAALIPEEAFLEQYPGQGKVHVLCAEVEGYDNLRGQLLAVEVSSLRDTIGSLKERLADVLGVAANRQRISRDGLGFLRDELSLAHYNVSPDVQLQLGVKERGGRKK